MKKGFTYDDEQDYFLCKKGKTLVFYNIYYKKTGQLYYGIYRIFRKASRNCKRFADCVIDRGAVRINTSSFYPAYYANRKLTKSQSYCRMKRMQSIWREGAFAALKAKHNLRRIYKIGLHGATEECLMAAISLNVKRMIAAPEKINDVEAVDLLNDLFLLFLYAVCPRSPA